MKFFNHYKTIVISDIPIGASPEHFKKLIYFLKNTSCDKLIFTGDIIKGWQSKNIENLHKPHNKFLKTLLKISERDNTKIIFVTGDEWNYKNNENSLNIFNLSFVKEFKFNSGGNIFSVIMDSNSSSIKNISFKDIPLQVGRHSLLLWFNEKYNLHRIRRGYNYSSILKPFENIIHKNTANDLTLPNYQLNLVDISIKKKCNGIICGHPAYSGIHNFGNISYLSIGNWTETLTGLAESNYGQWEIINYEKIVSEIKESRLHADIMEELFEEEKEMINLNSQNLT
jgi:UDP-2,3-diacylglucosamine pyrophosphatase LpxH